MVVTLQMHILNLQTLPVPKLFKFGKQCFEFKCLNVIESGGERQWGKERLQSEGQSYEKAKGNSK